MRFIFYRTGAIGDVIHCLPALKYLKEKYPEASIELLTHCEGLKAVLESYAPFLDAAYIGSKKRAIPNELLESLKSRPCDIFTYLHSNFLKAILLNLKFFKAKKINIYKKDLELSSRENFLLAFERNMKPDLLQERYDNNLLNSLLDYECLKSSLNISAAAVKPYIVVVPGVGKLRPQRAFPLSRWESFIQKILNETDFDIKILGGPDEAELSLRLNLDLKLRSPENKRIENLIGKLDLLETTRILELATKVYACDTGLLHIAAALGKEIETIYSVTSEFRTGPYSPNVKIFRSKYCKCQYLKNFHDNKTKCPYVYTDNLPRCIEDLNFTIPV